MSADRLQWGIGTLCPLQQLLERSMNPSSTVHMKVAARLLPFKKSHYGINVDNFLK
jgi:hypothetical protein